MTSARRPSSSPQDETGYWPFDQSHEPVMNIGEAVAALRPEFPSMKNSRLRFMEQEGLVRPHRTASGYRKFSQADLHRVRYALIQQRDHFRPLRHIAEMLAELDAGREVEELPTARVVSVAGRLVSRTGSERVGRRELAELSGAELQLIDDIAASGLIKPDAKGRYHVRSIDVVTAVIELGRAGIEPRHLHHLSQACARSAGLVTQAVAPLRAGRQAIAQERAEAQASELAGALARLAADMTLTAVGDQLSR